MTWQLRKQKIAIHILPNIWRSKGNEAIKFCPLIENNMRKTFFLKNYTQTVVETLFSDPFLKNQNWAYRWINSLWFAFIVCQLEDCQNIFKLSCRPFPFIWYKAFQKNKKRCGIGLPASFPAWSLKKIFLLLYFINWPNFIVWLSFKKNKTLRPLFMDGVQLPQG